LNDFDSLDEKENTANAHELELNKTSCPTVSGRQGDGYLNVPEFAEFVPLDQLPTPPTIDLRLFPSGVADYARAVADSVCFHNNLAAAFALGVLSVANINRCVNVHQGWTEPLCLYVAGVGRSGAGKTPMLKPFRKPFDEFQRSYNQAHADEIQKRADDIQRWEAEKQVARKPRKGGSLTRSLDELNDLLRDNPPLYKKCLYLGDTTPEALTDALIEQGGKIALLSGEPTMFDILAGMYSDRPNLDLVTNAYDGEPVHSRRKKDGQKDIEHAYLSAVLGVQTERVQEILENKRLRDSGVMPRFCYFVQLEKFISVKDSKPIPAASEAQFNGLISHLLSGSGDLLYLSDEVRSTFLNYVDECRRRVMEGGEWDYCAEWGSKQAGRALRIAANFHTCLHLDPATKPIDGATMTNAITLSEQLAEHATHLFRRAELPKETADALYVWKRIASIKSMCFSKVELTRKVQGKADLDYARAIEKLVANGYIKVVIDAKEKVGRPAEMIFVNEISLIH
jgi:hypothetical protein